MHIEITIKFKTTMIMLSLCEYSDAYILLKRTITVVGQGADDTAIKVNSKSKQVVFKCALDALDAFTRCISDINNNKLII